MKKSLCVLMCVCLALMICPVVSASDAIVLDGTWKILVSNAPTSYERFAAEKLRSCLSEILGSELETVSAAAGQYIAVGSASEADVSDVADNGYVIKAIDGNIHIGGTGVRGLQIGAYRFLEEFCGRKVYSADIGPTAPKASAITVPADANVRYEPFFEYTDTDWRSPHNVEYSMANGLYGGAYRSIPAEMGGTVNYLGGFCHTMGALCETEKYAETHPEYLALRDGKRTTAQPCLMNPDVLAIATKNVLDILAKRYDPNASLQIVSVTQNDNYNYCTCDACRAFEAAHGGVQSATMLNFVNQIADAVKEAGYTNVGIDTFAYQYTRKAPKGIVPRDNVIVRLCTIECCFSHALDDPSCKRNVELMQDLRDWSAICNRLHVWDYVTNYAHTCTVFPDFGVIQRNIQVFYENNVCGVYEEGNYYIAQCDTEFGELRAYMIAKCLQDPYCDLDREINGFLEAFYGPGWRAVRIAIDMYTENAGDKNGHVMIYFGSKQSLTLTNRQIETIDACWEIAKKAAADERQLARVERSEISWRYWKANMRKSEFSLWNPNRFEEKQRLFDDIRASGAMTISEGGYEDYLDCICIKYALPDEWNDYEANERGAQTRLFFGKILEPMMPVLTGFGVFYKLSRTSQALRILEVLASACIDMILE